MANAISRPSFSALLLCALLGWTSVACAPLGSTSGGGEFNTITQEELMATEARSLLEAIQRTRPNWLRVRGDRSLEALGTRILVYLNDSKLGSPQETLRTFPVESVHHIQRANSSEAGQLPGAGIGHVDSAILIYTRPQS